MAQATTELPKLSIHDPALKSLNQIAKILEPFSREQQLQALAAACSQLGMIDYAIAFLRQIKIDRGEE